MERRRGPFGVEIRHGSWEERLRSLLDAERAAASVRERTALVVEGRPEADGLAQIITPHLGEDLARFEATPGLLLLTEQLEALREADEKQPFLAICVAGTGNRKDGIRAAWKLGSLKDRLWVFIHDATPASGLVPTVGEHVRRYLDIVEGLAFTEGPRGR
ncbi:hypothetical protein ACFL59_09520 [Planctomycetota bacterium]